MGDFNAKIGETQQDTHLRSVVGNYGSGVRNERGKALIDFCAVNGLYIANSHFKHHVRRLYTWRSPDGRTRNQIDYILIRERWRTSMRDVKTYPGFDCESDHNALVAELCLKLHKPVQQMYSEKRWHLNKDQNFTNSLTDSLQK